MKDYPIEQYREHIPRLRKRARAARVVALLWSGLAVPQIVIGGLALDQDGWINFVVAGILLMGSIIGSVVKKNAEEQVDVINKGGRPTGVYMALVKADEKQLEDKVMDLPAQIEQVRSEAEKLAEDESQQWWRQEGSLWHETQQFIDSADEVFKARERAEFDRMMAEQVAAIEAEKAEAKRLDQERRIAATQRWIEEQREWDAFKEDAQVDARNRKERGEWYEPPLGVPGAIKEEDPIAAAEADIKRVFEEHVERMNQQLWATSMGTFDVHAWGKPEPIRSFRERESRERCDSTGKVIYTGPQVKATLDALKESGVGSHYTFFECGMHFHLARVVR